MTLLLTPITSATFDMARSAMRQALAAGAEGIELRLDLMTEVTDEQVAALCAEVPAGRAILLTIRGRAEGGGYDGDDDQRVSRLIALGPLVTHIDVEQELWDRSANIRQKVLLAVRRAADRAPHGEAAPAADDPPRAEAAGRRRLMISRHFPVERPATLSRYFVEMVDEPACDVIKLAWRARTIRDNLEALELMRESPRPILAICMGPEGLMSRILARKFGGFASFAALDEQHRSADGQIPLATMRGLYRWDRIGPATRLYAVAGDPLTHSLSPAVHNAAFDAHDIDAVYLPLRIAPGYESFKAALAEFVARDWLELRGLSVTAPHKEHALRFVIERGGAVSPAARRVGAANTLTLDADGAIAADNTDAPAVLESLCRSMNIERAALRGRTVDLLGAGGVARACAAALCDAGTRLTLYNRSAARSEALAQEFGCRHRDWNERGAGEGEVLVNATTVGQSPHDDQMPVPPERLRAGLFVFDTIYRPQQTRLLAEAGRRGGRCCGGLEMFLHQAAEQFRIWHGVPPPLEVMREAAMKSH